MRSEHDPGCRREIVEIELDPGLNDDAKKVLIALVKCETVKELAETLDPLLTDETRAILEGMSSMTVEELESISPEVINNIFDGTTANQQSTT